MNILKKLAQKPLTLIATIVVFLYLILAISSDVYQYYCYKNNITPAFAIEEQNNCNASPSKEHFLGTDYMGRDIFLRAIAGSSTAMKIGIVAGLISVFIGVSLGIISGFYGGVVDKIVVWLYSTFASMPALLFILAFTLLLSKGFLSQDIMQKFNKLQFNSDLFAIYIAIGLTGWVTLCRVIRAETMKLKTMQYVEGAKVIGRHNFAILIKHILPNLFHLIIIYFTLRFGFAVMTEVIVSYLGLGAQSSPSWGIMISNGQERLWSGAWHEVGGATIFMFILVLSLNILGDGLRDVLDPKLQESK